MRETQENDGTENSAPALSEPATGTRRTIEPQARLAQAPQRDPAKPWLEIMVEKVHLRTMVMEARAKFLQLNDEEE